MRQREGPTLHDTRAGELVLLDGADYTRNVSIARLRNHRQMARHFTTLAAGRERPDVIVASYPTIELAEAAVAFGRSSGIPVIIDVRDLWPDLFLDILSPPLRWGGRIALAPLYRAKKKVMRGAAAVFAANDDFLAWALAAAGRPCNASDGVYPLAYAKTSYPAEVLARADANWTALGLEAHHRVACFFGNLSTRVLDLDTVIEAARLLKTEDPDALIVVCGDNGQLESLREKSSALPILLPGWVDGADIQTLMARASAGLFPYQSRWDFVGHIPNKPIEYMAGGLPVVSGLSGKFAELLETYNCGVSYADGDARALADALLSVLGDPTLASEMSANATSVFEDRFSADVVYSRYLADVLQVAMRGSSRAGSEQ